MPLIADTEDMIKKPHDVMLPVATKSLEDVVITPFDICITEKREVYCWKDFLHIAQDVPPFKGGAAKVASDVDGFGIGTNFWCFLRSGKLYCAGGNFGSSQIEVPVAGGPIDRLVLHDGYAFMVSQGKSVKRLGWEYWNKKVGIEREANFNVRPSLIVMGDTTDWALVSGSVYWWGAGFFLGDSNYSPQKLPTRVPLAGDVTTFSAAYHHACAVVKGEVWCWGENPYGEVGGKGDAVEPRRIEGLHDITSVAVGEVNTCAANSIGVWCWGSNLVGQLGVQTTETCDHVSSEDPSGHVAVPCSRTPVKTLVLKK